MTQKKLIALVTGGNRGIGFEVCRQLAQLGHRVILGSRNPENGKEAQKKLHAEGLEVQFHRLDVTSPADIEETRNYIEKNFGRLDILVNNAGILLDTLVDDPKPEDISVFNAKPETIRKTFETNTLGPLLMCQKLIPLMRKNGYGRVVNLSSGMGQLDEMGGGYPGYRLSKTALNAVTRIFSSELEGTHILVNSVCPGWVKTDMGGEGAERTPAEAAKGIVWLATLPDGGPTGGFFRDQERIPW